MSQPHLLEPIAQPPWRRRFVEAVAWLWMALCLIGTASADGPEGPWQAPLGQGHPLTGRIWDVTAARFVDAATLVNRLTKARFVLLGEKHDNPDHHRLQAWVLEKLIEAGRDPSVGFEMFTVDDAPAIERYMAQHPKEAAGLGDAVEWARSGWPDWALYQPIADIALREGLSIVATNLSPSTVRDMAAQGLNSLGSEQVRRLGLDRPLSPDLQMTMTEEIRQAHCDYAPEERVEAMIAVQRARDAQMAERLMAAGGQDGAVLIAGAGHVRQDYGVPLYLRDRAPGATVLSVAFVEVSEDKTEPITYAGRFHRSALPFDYLWFTPRVDDDDPCEAFDEQLKKLQKGS